MTPDARLFMRYLKWRSTVQRLLLAERRHSPNHHRTPTYFFPYKYKSSDQVASHSGL